MDEEAIFAAALEYETPLPGRAGGGSADRRPPRREPPGRRPGGRCPRGPCAGTDEDLDTVLQLDRVLFKSVRSQVRHVEYERLFRRYGVDLSTQSDEEAAARIRGRFIAVDLAIALDQWHVFTFDKAFNLKLFAVARQADPDDWRNRVRAAAERDDRAAVEEVERTAPVEQLPPATIRTIAMCSGWDPLALREQPRRDFMRSALLRFPNDVWLNWFLADSLTYCEPKNIEEGGCRVQTLHPAADAAGSPGLAKHPPENRATPVARYKLMRTGK